VPFSRASRWYLTKALHQQRHITPCKRSTRAAARRVLQFESTVVKQESFQVATQRLRPPDQCQHNTHTRRRRERDRTNRHCGSSPTRTITNTRTSLIRYVHGNLLISVSLHRKCQCRVGIVGADDDSRREMSRYQCRKLPQQSK
jgi:hypothetical protein